MKRQLLYITCALGLGLTGAVADPVVDAGPGVPAAARTERVISTKQTELPDGSTLERTRMETRSISPARLQNKVVVDATGATVATVDRVIEDERTGRVRYTVLSDEEHRYIVPFSAFTVGERDGELSLRLPGDRARLAASPKFIEGSVTSYTTRETAQPVYSYWGVSWD
jgi:hypothetical protein